MRISLLINNRSPKVHKMIFLFKQSLDSKKLLLIEWMEHRGSRTSKNGYKAMTDLDEALSSFGK